MLKPEQEDTIKKQRNIISLPDRFWTAIDNKIDGELINSRGDALIHMLLELEKFKPEVIELEKMVYIPRSKLNDLNSIKTLQSKSLARPWLTEKTIVELEIALNLSTENSISVALNEIKTTRKLADTFVKLRQENIDLKKKLAEIQPAQS